MVKKLQKDTEKLAAQMQQTEDEEASLRHRISETTEAAEMSQFIGALKSNRDLQLNSLVFYGLSLAHIETGRTLAHFIGTQKRMRNLRLQDCSL